MSIHSLSGFQLVFTVALKKEVPTRWIKAQGIPVHTIESLLSGISIAHSPGEKGIVLIITGPGPEAARRAAFWILEHLSPLYVVNIGTCGCTSRSVQLGTWITPRTVQNERGEFFPLDTRVPFPLDEPVASVRSILSVKEEKIGSLPSSWKNHDVLDMECYEQAKVFYGSSVTFHCLKFTSDYSDAHAFSDFHTALELFSEKVKDLFSFAFPQENIIKIAVVIPTYNRSLTLQRAIDSVIAQTYKPDEIFVVDDASTDGTQDLLREYQDRITVIPLKEPAGPSRARNQGIDHATTEWIAFLDSDDHWTKNKLASQVEYLKKYPFYNILQSNEIWIRNGVRVNPCDHHKKPVGWIWRQSLERCLISPSSVLVKKSLLEKYGGFNKDLPVCEDYDLWLKISRDHPVGLDQELSVIKYGGHDDQLSRCYPAMDRFRVHALIGRLADEPLRSFQEDIVAVLEKKLSILLKGAEKRGNRDEASSYKHQLSSIRTYQKSPGHR